MTNLKCSASDIRLNLQVRAGSHGAAALTRSDSESDSESESQAHYIMIRHISVSAAASHSHRDGALPQLRVNSVQVKLVPSRSLRLRLKAGLRGSLGGGEL